MVVLVHVAVQRRNVQKPMKAHVEQVVKDVEAHERAQAVGQSEFVVGPTN